MIKTIKLSKNEFDDLAVCAFRYALSRQTYVPDDISKILIKNKEFLEPKTRELIKKEITQYETKYGFSFIDKPIWDNLKQEIY